MLCEKSAMLPSDGQIGPLILRAQSGDQDALSQLCARYRPFLEVIAAVKLGRGIVRRVDASDIVQETELEMVRGFKDFRGATEPELSAWLKTMLRRNIADKVRDNRAAIRDLRRERYLDGVDASASITWTNPAGREASPSQLVMNGEAALRFAAALEALPVDQRTVVRMRYMEGMKLIEIAGCLNKTPGAVAGLLRRGQNQLREEIGSLSRIM
jgi:RNA polymerase sigma-70 factor (ECF subfamily)